MNALPNLTIKESLADKRVQGRNVYYVEDNYQLICLPYNLRVFDINVTGALVYAESENFIENIKVLENLALSINNCKVATIETANVRHCRKYKEGYLVGLEFFSKNKKSALNRRKLSRVFMHKNYQPILSAPHPFNFDDEVFFQLLNISAEGATLSCSLRNKMIFKDMVFEKSDCTLPNYGNYKLSFKITHCHVGKDKLRLGAVFVNPPKSFIQALPAFLLQYRDEPLFERLKNIGGAGFKLKKLKNVASYTYAQTPEHYRDLKMLRWQSYANAGKINARKSSSDDMLDEFDHRSRIILAYIGEHLVGSVRFTFCNDRVDHFEMEGSIKLPEKFVGVNSVEASRLCVLTELQGTDIVHGLMERCTQLFLKSDRKYLITSCTSELLNFYKKIGYKYSGHSFRLPSLNNKEHFLISITSDRAINAKKVNPFFWFFTYSRSVDYLEKLSFIDRGVFSRVKLKSIKLLVKLAMYFRSKVKG